MKNTDDILVFDIGGTTFRSAIFRDNKCIDINRVSSPNFIDYPNMDVFSLQQMLIAMILDEVNNREKLGYCFGKICISFPGMVKKTGYVEDAPTLWGEKRNRINIINILKETIAHYIYCINDVSAAGYKFSEKYDRFCIITVSSGIGNKCFWDGHLLINDGLGGEIGHINIGHFLTDDSGGKGHLAAIASGRGSVRLANYLKNELDSYKSSVLYNKDINTFSLVDAFRVSDTFAEEIIRIGASKIANIINVHINSLGILKYLFIGGFAGALGEKYKKLIEEELEKLKPYVIGEIKDKDIIILVERSDTHCLEGCGIYVNKLEEISPR